MTNPPPNPHDFKKRFHDFIMRRENRGFNSAFARHRQDRDDSYVSRMHSPFEPDVKFWLHDAAEHLHKACLASLVVGKFALSMLAEVVARHEGSEEAEPSVNGLEAAYHNFRATLAQREDGMATDAQVEAARNALVEVVARVGAGCKTMSARDVERALDGAG